MREALPLALAGIFGTEMITTLWGTNFPLPAALLRVRLWRIRMPNLLAQSHERNTMIGWEFFSILTGQNDRWFTMPAALLRVRFGLKPSHSRKAQGCK